MGLRPLPLVVSGETDAVFSLESLPIKPALLVAAYAGGQPRSGYASERSLEKGTAVCAQQIHRTEPPNALRQTATADEMHQT